MLATIASALILFTAYILGALSLFSKKDKFQPMVWRTYLVSGAVAGALTLFYLYFFIE